jgi:hypothetical protein
MRNTTLLEGATSCIAKYVKLGAANVEVECS